MTSPSEILLPITPSAPIAVGRNSASHEKNGRQNTEIKTSQKNVRNFKEHLAQVTDKKADQPKNISAQKKPVQTTEQISTQRHDTPLSHNSPISKFKKTVAQNTEKPAVAQNTEKPGKAGNSEKADSTIQATAFPLESLLPHKKGNMAIIPTEKSVKTKESPKPEAQNTEIASVQAAPALSLKNGIPSLKNGILAEQPVKDAPIKVTLSGHNKEIKPQDQIKKSLASPVLAKGEKTVQTAAVGTPSDVQVSTNYPVKNDSNHKSSDQENSPKPLTVGQIAKAAETPQSAVSEAKNTKLAPQKTPITPVSKGETSTDQNISEKPHEAGTDSEKISLLKPALAGADKSSLPANDLKTTKTIKTTDVPTQPQQATAAPLRAEQQPLAPAMTQPLVPPPPQSVAQNNPVAGHGAKDTTKAVGKDIGKDAGKENNVASHSSKKAAASSEHKHSASQKSTDDTKTGDIAQSKPAKISGPNTLPAKISFLTELNQNLVGGENRPAPLGSLQLTPALLSVQEVGQHSLHAGSLMAASHIKPPMLPVTPQMLTSQINMAISKQITGNNKSFTINLKPADLGQVDIKMDFKADGKMAATVTVDNGRTLALLQRDHVSLERILGNSGFDLSGGNLNFTLKKQQHEQSQHDAPSKGSADGEDDSILSLPSSMISQQNIKLAYSHNALDINI